MPRRLALILTVLTGLTGLVYEITWQKYLATLLGSHSEATAAVLGIFLAGLSVGYALFGRLTRRMVTNAERENRSPRLLWMYGWVEGGIGFYALLFPTLFRGVQLLSTAVPHAAAGPGFAYDVGLAVLLVAPPTILMGATIPVLTQALARNLEDATRIHALIYALNTAGAFAGALSAGFVLVPLLGLVWVMTAMGALNLGAGAVFLWLGRRGRQVVSLAESPAEAEVSAFGSYAAVALLLGFAMMAVQTVLIRLGGLSFGASQFTFATVVAVFVLCIALGSLAVSVLPRLPASLLLIDVWALGAILYLLYGPLDLAPYWVHRLRILFPSTDAAFYPFYLAGFAAILVVIGIPVMLSGATLPLLFHHLRRQTGHLGDLAGRIYGWNTVGSLLGALLGGYALLFWLDLHHVYRIAIGAVVCAAVLLTVRLRDISRWLAAPLLIAPALGALLLLDPWDPKLLSAGFFHLRSPQPLSYRGADALAEKHGHRVRFYDDDPAVSVAVKEGGSRSGRLERSIITNGKSDGATERDYPTMGLIAAISAVLAQKMEHAFVIGYGTGITAGEFAALDSTREVVVAEISAGVIRAAPLFDFANRGASRHPKIRIVRSDAYRALLRRQDRFDVIASEPSNPWVTGVEMLFSREFLKAARDRLNPGGIYLQWYHLYETDAASVALVLRTFASVFDSVAVWYGLGNDLFLVGFQDETAVQDLERIEVRATRPDIAASLRRSGVRSFPALLAHELLPLGVVHRAGLDGPVHTLLHPRLSYRAGRAFFRGGWTDLPFTGQAEAARVGAQNSLVRRYAAGLEPSRSDGFHADLVTEACNHRARLCAALTADWGLRHPDSARLEALRRKRRQAAAVAAGLDEEGERVLAALLSRQPRSGSSPVAAAQAERATEVFRGFYRHAVPFDPARLLELWEKCEPPADQPDACRLGLERARALVAGGDDRGRSS